MVNDLTRYKCRHKPLQTRYIFRRLRCSAFTALISPRDPWSLTSIFIAPGRSSARPLVAFLGQRSFSCFSFFFPFGFRFAVEVGQMVEFFLRRASMAAIGTNRLSASRKSTAAYPSFMVQLHPDVRRPDPVGTKHFRDAKFVDGRVLQRPLNSTRRRCCAGWPPVRCSAFVPGRTTRKLKVCPSNSSVPAFSCGAAAVKRQGQLREASFPTSRPRGG